MTGKDVFIGNTRAEALKEPVLRVASSPDMAVRITIADDGKGIAPGDIPRFS